MGHLLLKADARMIPLRDESVHCCVTSPPYWGLRDYGLAGQLGLEKTPEEYVAHMVEVFREVRRVLRRDGTLWLNLGDCYASLLRSGRDESPGVGAKQAIGPVHTAVKWHAGDGSKFRWTLPGGQKPKDLMGMPWRVAFALQADGWWLRSDIIWAKPNPMPESVTDRPTKAHEYLFLLAKAERYFYDADAVREGLNYPDRTYGPSDNHKTRKLSEQGNRTTGGLHDGRSSYTNPAGHNKRSWWVIPTEPYPEAHFATFPSALVTPCIKAGCPVGGIVLDPFCGSGTTIGEALRLGRKGIGIDLGYHDLSQKRVARLAARGEQYGLINASR
jgi:DNA modification methylase